jgi:hypothetical protein
MALSLSNQNANSSERLDHIVDLAGHDSFPASDPPGWWAGPDAPTRSERGVVYRHGSGPAVASATEAPVDQMLNQKV